MQKYKMSLWGLLFFLTQVAVHSQTPFHKNKKISNGFYLDLGYIHEKLLGDKIQKRVENDIIKPSGGFYAGAKYVIQPIAFQVNYFGSTMNVENYDWSFDNDQKLNHQGIEAKALLQVLHFSPGIQLFIGGGYQWNSMSVGDRNDKENNPSEYSSLSYGLFQFTSELNLVLESGYGVQVAYNRSMELLDNQMAMYQIKVGIVFRY